MRISSRATRVIVGVLALSVASQALTSPQRAQVTRAAGESTDRLEQRLGGRQRRIDKGDSTPSKREQEVRAWHAAIQKRAELNAQPAVRSEQSVVNTDFDDIDVMQGDVNLITQADPFDLQGRSV